MKKIISEDAHAAIGPYSQGIYEDGWVYVSGQLPINRQTGAMITDVSQATEQCIKNMVAVLAERNMDLSNVCNVTVYLTDMDDFEEMNDMYKQYFNDPYPSRACVAVNAVPYHAVILMKCIAHI